MSDWLALARKRENMRRDVLVTCLVLSAIAVVSCGDDDADASDRDAGGSTGDNAGGKGGGGGTAAGQGAQNGGAGVAADSAVKCGSTTCAAPGGAMGFISACCADEAKSMCGMSLMGNPCSVPSSGDMRCPGHQVMGLTVPSCCTSDGLCGLDASMFGFGGCTDLKSAAAQAGAMMGGSGNLPSPRACDGSDAGADDAGS